MSLSQRSVLWPPHLYQAPMLWAHHKLPSSFMVTPFSFRFSTYWLKHSMREMKLALLALTSSTRYWSHFKKSLRSKKKKNWKLVLIFPESFKITRNFPLIIHNKVSKNLLSNFSSLLHSISHWQHSCHQKLSFSPNFVKLPLKAHFCCTFPLSPSSLTLQSSQVPNLGSFQFIGSSDFSNSSQQSFRGRGEKDSRGHR